MIKRHWRNVLMVIAVGALVSVGLFGFAVLKVTTYKVMTGQPETSLPILDDVPREYWAKLAQKRIFFVHSGLGDEIIDGIKAVVNDHNYLNLNIVETSDPDAFENPVFAHEKIGKCLYPESKLNGFESALDAGIGEKVDIAFLKFCYVDVIWQSDAKSIFQRYQAMLKTLKARYPQTTFLHMTVPISPKRRGVRKIFRESIKYLIGRPSNFDDNLRRHQYNALLHQAFSQTDVVFDLALAESINPNGLSCYSTVRGVERVLAKAPEYTIAYSSHLTKEGSKKIAESNC